MGLKNQGQITARPTSSNRIDEGVKFGRVVRIVVHVNTLRRVQMNVHATSHPTKIRHHLRQRFSRHARMPSEGRRDQRVGGVVTASEGRSGHKFNALFGVGARMQVRAQRESDLAVAW